MSGRPALSPCGEYLSTGDNGCIGGTPPAPAFVSLIKRSMGDTVPTHPRTGSAKQRLRGLVPSHPHSQCENGGLRGTPPCPHTPEVTMPSCTLCPRRCGADRSRSRGFCGVGSEIRIAGVMLHHWEEPCISGSLTDGVGSGAVFFVGCPLHCVFCQNGGISDGGDKGTAFSPEDLAAAMLDLQAKGAYNINLVSPTQYTDAIIEAISIARPRSNASSARLPGKHDRRSCAPCVRAQPRKSALAVGDAKAQDEAPV